MALNSAQRQELNDALDQYTPTKRAIAPELEAILYQPLPVLDHGFIRVIDYMGDDSAIVQAARVSYGKGTKQVNQDQGLINYLLRHRHTTPFEMCEIKFHLKMPIFVARQWIRHRTANVNEYSARYSIMDKEFYIPKPEHLAVQSTTNNQGRGELLTSEAALHAMEVLRNDALQAHKNYLDLMNLDEDGNVVDENKQSLARELARINMPVNFYTQMYWKIDLHNLLHFLSLRADPHAQYEIRVYAEIMLDIVKKWVPFTYEAFMKYHKNGAKVSQQGLDVIRRMIAGEKVTQEMSGMNPREWRELQETLGLTKDR